MSVEKQRNKENQTARVDETKKECNLTRACEYRVKSSGKPKRKGEGKGGGGVVCLLWKRVGRKSGDG
jgi:hypothetical protein